MGELNHECGVAAVYHAAGAIVSPLTPIPGDVNSVARLIPRMLLDMQNRGQLAAGMTSYNPQRPSILGDPQGSGDRRGGVPAQPSLRNSNNRCAGTTARPGSGMSATPPAATDDRSYAQPFEREHGRKTKWFSFAFNGQLANFGALKQELLDHGDYHLKRDTDTEILMHAISYELQGEGPEIDWRGVFSRIAERVRWRVQHRPDDGQR